jgi:hypothetical protein
MLVLSSWIVTDPILRADGSLSVSSIISIIVIFRLIAAIECMQPLDNGPFNSLKATYLKELKTLNSLNDSRPIDKINFIRAYSKARSQSLTEQNIKSAFRTTGNWPISRRKALSHLETQQIQEPSTVDRKLAPETGYDSEVTQNQPQCPRYGNKQKPNHQTALRVYCQRIRSAKISAIYQGCKDCGLRSRQCASCIHPSKCSTFLVGV